MRLKTDKRYITRDPTICNYAEVIDFVEVDSYFKVKFYGGSYDGLIGWYEFDGTFLWGYGKIFTSANSNHDLIAEYQENIEFDLEKTQKQLEDLCDWE